ncbi:hypothetical protein [Ensifer canadensis]
MAEQQLTVQADETPITYGSEDQSVRARVAALQRGKTDGIDRLA